MDGYDASMAFSLSHPTDNDVSRIRSELEPPLLRRRHLLGARRRGDLLAGTGRVAADARR